MPNHRIPVVSVVGRSDSGKTGVMESLIRELTSRGHRVATVKHHHKGDIQIDVPGKDSWRHARAGSVTTIISSPETLAVISRVDRDRTLEELVQVAGDADILLTEGFKRAETTMVEVIRRARSDELVSDPAALWAVITDDADLVPSGVLVFRFDEVGTKFADTIERELLTGSGV